MRYYISAQINQKTVLVTVNATSITSSTQFSFLPLERITVPINKLLQTIDDLENSITNPVLVQFTVAQSAIITKQLANRDIKDIAYLDTDKLIAAYQNLNRDTQFTANELADHVLRLAEDNNHLLTILQLNMALFTVVHILNHQGILSQETIAHFNNIEQFSDTSYGPKIPTIQKRFEIFSGNPIMLLSDVRKNTFLTKYDDIITEIITSISAGSIFDKIAQYNHTAQSTNLITVTDKTIQF